MKWKQLYDKTQSLNLPTHQVIEDPGEKPESPLSVWEVLQMGISV